MATLGQAMDNIPFSELESSLLLVTGLEWCRIDFLTSQLLTWFTVLKHSSPAVCCFDTWLEPDLIDPSPILSLLHQQAVGVSLNATVYESCIFVTITLPCPSPPSATPSTLHPPPLLPPFPLLSPPSPPPPSSPPLHSSPLPPSPPTPSPPPSPSVLCPS